MNRTYQIFYSFYTDDAHIDGSSPITVSAAELPQYFSRLQQHHDFLGIIDRHDNTYQILLEEFSGFYWGEIPDPVKAGAHGRFYSAEEMLELLEKFQVAFLFYPIGWSQRKARRSSAVPLVS